MSEFVSLQHLLAIIFNLVIVSLIYIYCVSRKNKRLTFAVVMLIIFIIDQFLRLYYFSGENILTEIPLSLCGLTYILSVIILFTNNEKLFKYTLFCSVGAVIAIIFPNGNGMKGVFDIMSIRHYTSHLMIIASQIFMIKHLHFKIKHRDYIKVLVGLYIVGACLFFLNLKLSTNFFFLNTQVEEHPITNLVGPWPNNLIVFVIFSIPLLFGIEKLYFLFVKK